MKRGVTFRSSVETVTKQPTLANNRKQRRTHLLKLTTDVWSIFKDGVNFVPGFFIEKDFAQRLFSEFELVKTPAGETLYKQGDEATSFAILVEGEALVQVSDSSSKPCVVRELSRLAFVGHFDVVANATSLRSAQVVAQSDCEWLQLGKQAFWSLLNSTFPDHQPKAEMAKDVMLKLCNIQCFADCRTIFMEAVANLAKFVTYRQDDLIPGLDTNMVVIVRGCCRTRAEVRRKGDSTTMQRIETGTVWRAGACIGETAMLGIPKRKMQTAIVLEEMVALVIPRQEFWEMLNHFPAELALFTDTVKEYFIDVAGGSVSAAPLFKSFPKESIVEINTMLTKRFYRPNEAVTSHNESDRSMFVVQRGALNVSISGIIVRTLQDNDYFGEVPVFAGYGSPEFDHNAHAVAVQATHCSILLELARSDLRGVLRKFAGLAYCLVDEEKPPMTKGLAVGTPMNMRKSVAPRQSVYDDGAERGTGRRLVQKFRFFTRASSQCIDHIYKILEAMTFLKDQYIVKEGDPCRNMFVLNEGRALVFVLDREVGQVVDGDSFGESAILAAHSKSFKRQASVRSVAMCHLWALDAEVLMSVIEQYPEEYVQFKRFAKKQFEKTENSAPSLYKAFPLFQHCCEEFMFKLELYIERRVYFPEDLIITQGTRGTELFIMSSGKAVVEVNGEKKNDIDGMTCFGELAVLGLFCERRASVRAVEVCDVQVLHKHVLDHAFQEYPAEKQKFDDFAAQRQFVYNGGEPLVMALLRAEIEFLRDAPGEMLRRLFQSMEVRACMPGMPVNPRGDLNLPDGMLFVIFPGVLEVRALCEEETILHDDDGDKHADVGIGAEKSFQDHEKEQKRLEIMQQAAKDLRQSYLEDGIDMEHEEQAEIPRHTIHRALSSKVWNVVTIGKAGDLCGKMPEMGIDQGGAFRAKESTIVCWMDRRTFYSVVVDYPEQEAILRRMAKPDGREFALDSFREHLKLKGGGSYLQAWKQVFGPSATNLHGLNFKHLVQLCGKVDFWENLVELWGELSPDRETFGLAHIDLESATRVEKSGSVEGAILKETISIARTKNMVNVVGLKAKQQQEDRSVLRTKAQIIRQTVYRFFHGWRVLIEKIKFKRQQELPRIDLDKPIELDFTDPWVKRVTGIFRCGMSTRRVYGESKTPWVTDNSLVKGPGFPTVPADLPVIVTSPRLPGTPRYKRRAPAGGVQLFFSNTS